MLKAGWIRLVLVLCCQASPTWANGLDPRPPYCEAFFRQMLEKILSPEEQQLIHQLRYDPVVEVSYPKVLETNESPTVLHLRSGRKIIFKTNEVSRRSSGMNKEIAAYLLDRTLNLNLVPVTFARNHQGIRGSAQVFVEGFHKTQSVYKTPELIVFDFLIHTMDRTPENVIWTNNGKLHAIDHGYAFNEVANPIPHLIQSQQRVLQSAKQAPDLLNQLRHTSDADLKALLEPLIGVPETQQLLLRKGWLFQNLK